MASEWEIEETNKIKMMIFKAKNNRDLSLAYDLYLDLKNDEDYYGFFNSELDALFLEAKDEFEEKEYLSLSSVNFILEEV